MLKYTVQRILLMLFTLLVITLMCFILVRMLPLPELPSGDPHTEVINKYRDAMGYNEPYLVQFGLFLKGPYAQRHPNLAVVAAGAPRHHAVG